jgi:dTDP-4-dehydrorhamnose 3,5-epimerase
MRLRNTDLPGVVIIEREVFKDNRGYFLELSRLSDRLNTSFVQDNLSRSVWGTVRGLHYQLRHSQAKLVTCIHGVILDVTVDIRRGSPTFGKHVLVKLAGADTGKQVFVPAGFAHGFLVLSEYAIIHYKCSDYYDPESARGIMWNDPALKIDWRIREFSLVPRLSEKDAKNPLLKDAELPEYIRSL